MFRMKPQTLLVLWLAAAASTHGGLAAAQSPAIPASTAAALRACTGLMGTALQNCVAQQQGGGYAANCAALGSPQRERCEAMKTATDDARAQCQSRFDVQDHSAFETCMREQTGRRRAASGH